MSLDGSIEGLIRDGSKVGVVHYLVHSVATTPKQVKSINEFISFEVKAHPNLFTGFGALHPDSEDVGADIFARGLCLPSDNKMTEEQQDAIISVVRKCFV